jgi:hypothetical protein
MVRVSCGETVSLPEKYFSVAGTVNPGVIRNFHLAFPAADDVPLLASAWDLPAFVSTPKFRAG